jgi:hypothetical protein
VQIIYLAIAPVKKTTIFIQISMPEKLSGFLKALFDFC